MKDEAKILIVEDDPIIALDLEDTLEAAGYAVSGPVRSVSDGLSAIERDPPSAATLDYQLGSETSEPLAEALAKRDIPFCFVSGRGDLVGRKDTPIVAKPAAPSAVLRVVESLLEP